jgi:hypothetical protein
LRFFWEQKYDNSVLRAALLSRDCLRIRIERYANCGMTQKLLHDFQLGTSRSKERRIGMAKRVPADSLHGAEFSRSAKDMVPNDLLRQVGPANTDFWDWQTPNFLVTCTTSGGAIRAGPQLDRRE